MLAVMKSLEEWRHFLEGAKHKVEIWTDHKNLEYFMTAKKLNQRQAQWLLYLSCGLTSSCTTVQGKVWVNVMHFHNVLIMLTALMLIATQPSFALNSSQFAHSKGCDRRH
jgi:hypothetical protein